MENNRSAEKKQTHKYTRIHTHPDTHTHTIHAHTHARTHTHTHAHTHMDIEFRNTLISSNTNSLLAFFLKYTTASQNQITKADYLQIQIM